MLGTQEGELYKVTLMCVDARVYECAHVLQDQKILAKLSAGDLVEQDGQYYSECLVEFYNRVSQQPDTMLMIKSIQQMW